MGAFNMKTYTDEMYLMLEYLLGQKDVTMVKANIETIMHAEILRVVTIAKLIADLRCEIERLKRELEELKRELGNGVA
jgi:uncharacterized small protein (DUF1192 family)